MSDALGSILEVATLGLIKAKRPDMPTIPEMAPQQTGQVVTQKSAAGLEEDEESKTKARKTARKGTAKFRIPLAASTTGAKATGATGIKI